MEIAETEILLTAETQMILTAKSGEKWKRGVGFFFFLRLRMVATNTTRQKSYRPDHAEPTGTAICSTTPFSLKNAAAPQLLRDIKSPVAARARLKDSLAGDRS